MRSYRIRIIAAAVIIVTVLALLLTFSSGTDEKYEGGTLVKAGENSIYAFSIIQGDAEESDEDAIYAYAKKPESVKNTVKKAYDSGIKAFINGDSENLVYIRKPGA